MRLRLGLNRPPPLVKRQNYEEEYSHSSFERPVAGKWRSQRLLSPFRQRLDQGYFGNEEKNASRQQLAGNRSSGQKKGGFFENYEEFGRWSRRSPQRAGRREVGMTHFDHMDSPTNDDWCDVRLDTRRVDNSYRGGYDFRDDVESIDSWEEEQRRRRRMAQARKECILSKRRDQSPPVSTLRKISRHEPPEYSATSAGSYPERPLTGLLESGSRRLDNFFSTRQDGSTVTSTIATNESDLCLKQSMSTFSNNSRSNPQLLHAKPLPELPPGYLQRNDGVVISLGSSIVSGSKVSERYADVDEQAEVAAQHIVEDLRALGYKIDDTNGILGSNSDSGQFSKYGGPSSWMKSRETTSVSSQLSQSRTITNKPSNYGIQGPPGGLSRGVAPLEKKASVSSVSMGKESVYRAKVRTSSNDAQSHGSRKSNTNAKPPIDARSNGSRKSSTHERTDARSTGSRNTNTCTPNDAPSTGSRRLNTQAANETHSVGSRKSSTKPLHDAQSVGSRKSNTTAPKDAQSYGSRKSHSHEPTDVKSTCSGKSCTKASSSTGSGRSGTRSERKSPLSTLAETDNSPFTTTYAETETDFGTRNSLIEQSQSEDYTDTKDSTIMADGSTLTSRPEDPVINGRTTPVVFDLQGTRIASSNPTESFSERITANSKRVNFSGEFPEMTSDGDRVPELVTKPDGLTAVLSDISHQRSDGASTLSSLTFNNPAQNPLSTFCDKLLYSCRISVFPSTQGG